LNQLKKVCILYCGESSLVKESKQQLDLDAVIRIVMSRQDYVKILLCLDEPKTQGELIECAISSGVFRSPTAVRYKIITLERHGVLKSVRMGKYRVITADKRVLEAVKKMVSGGSSVGAGAEQKVEEGEEEKKTGLEQSGAGFEAVATVVKDEEEEGKEE